MQTRHKVFQITYGFTCDCPTCTFLQKVGQIPDPSLEHGDLIQLGLKLREFVGVEHYLKTGKLEKKTLEELPKPLRSVLNESYMTELSETFSKSSHEGNYAKAADSGVTLLALYLLVYPKNYPQIGTESPHSELLSFIFMQYVPRYASIGDGQDAMEPLLRGFDTVGRGERGLEGHSSPTP
jgi:hypothetical protein